MNIIDFREICEKNLNIKDFPDDTEIVVWEKHPKYILEPFHVVYEGNSEYNKAISLNEVISKVK